MTLGLLTITHDEPDGLPRMLASVRDVIDGPTFAFHIGEKDETADILADWGAEVHRREWDGFNGSWTELFALAQGRADRFLYMQANHELLHPGPLPDLGATPCFMITYKRGPYDYRLPNLLRGDIEWSINAPVHGTLEPNFIQERRPLDAIAVQEHDDDGRRPEKLQRYLPIMEKLAADESDRPRWAFYLARTYFDLGRFEEAIEWYDKRIRMGGWDEEQWHAHYMKGVAQIRLGMFGEGRNTLLAAYHRRPSRAEPLMAICRSMNPPGGDLLAIERDAYAL